MPPFGWLRSNVHGSSIARWTVGCRIRRERGSWLRRHHTVVTGFLHCPSLICANWPFFASCQLRYYERILVEIVVFERGWVNLIANFGGNGAAYQRLLASENLRTWAITWRCLRDPTFCHFGTVRACDRQTDRRTDTWWRLIPALA